MNKEIILQPEIKYVATGYTSPVVIDNPIDKTVSAKFNLISEDGQTYDYPTIIVWGGDAYDTCGISGDGQWTDADLRARLDELLNT